MDEKRRKFQRVFGRTSAPGKPIDGLFVSIEEMMNAFGKPERAPQKPRVILWDFQKRGGRDRFNVFANMPRTRSEMAEMHITSESRPIMRCPGYCRNTTTNYSVWLVNRLVEKWHADEAAQAGK